MNKPLVVCICGSSRFPLAFQEANLRETLEGPTPTSVVLSLEIEGDATMSKPEHPAWATKKGYVPCAAYKGHQYAAWIGEEAAKVGCVLPKGHTGKHRGWNTAHLWNEEYDEKA